MSTTVAIDGPSPEPTFDSVRREVRAERARTTAERDAFRAFGRRITDLAASAHRRSGMDTGSLHLEGPLALEPPDNRQKGVLAAVETAYRETVMSLPFYEAEYGDTYEESVRGEFGEGLGRALTRPDCFGPTAIDVLQGAVRECIEERETVLETCDREEAALEEAAATVSPIEAELEAISAVDAERADFGALDANRTRLLAVRERIADVVRSRQSTIAEQRRDFDLSTDEPDVYDFLYADLDVTYPVLNRCADLDREVEQALARVERAMGRSP